MKCQQHSCRGQSNDARNAQRLMEAKKWCDKHLESTGIGSIQNHLYGAVITQMSANSGFNHCQIKMTLSAIEPFSEQIGAVIQHFSKENTLPKFELVYTCKTDIKNTELVYSNSPIRITNMLFKVDGILFTVNRACGCLRIFFEEGEIYGVRYDLCLDMKSLRKTMGSYYIYRPIASNDKIKPNLIEESLVGSIPKDRFKYFQAMSYVWKGEQMFDSSECFDGEDLYEFLSNDNIKNFILREILIDFAIDWDVWTDTNTIPTDTLDKLTYVIFGYFGKWKTLYSMANNQVEEKTYIEYIRLSIKKDLLGPERKNKFSFNSFEKSVTENVKNVVDMFYRQCNEPYIKLCDKIISQVKDLPLFKDVLKRKNYIYQKAHKSDDKSQPLYAPKRFIEPSEKPVEKPITKPANKPSQKPSQKKKTQFTVIVRDRKK